MCCLKEKHIFSFTNREALERVLNLLRKNYRGKIPRGTIYIATVSTPLKEIWNTLNLEEIMARNRFGGLFITQSLVFYTWREFEKVISQVEDDDYVFGKIEVEVR